MATPPGSIALPGPVVFTLAELPRDRDELDALREAGATVLVRDGNGNVSWHRVNEALDNWVPVAIDESERDRLASKGEVRTLEEKVQNQRNTDISFLATISPNYVDLANIPDTFGVRVDFRQRAITADIQTHPTLWCVGCVW